MPYLRQPPGPQSVFLSKTANLNYNWNLEGTNYIDLVSHHTKLVTFSEPPRNPPQPRPNRSLVRRPTEVRSRRRPEVTPAAAVGFFRVSQRNPRRVSGSQTTYKRTGSAWRKNSRRTWPRKTSLKGQRLSAKLCYSRTYTRYERLFKYWIPCWQAFF